MSASLEEDASYAFDFSLEGAMDVEAADAGFAALAEAADISIDLVGLALDAIPGVGEVALVAEVRGGRKTAAAPLRLTRSLDYPLALIASHTCHTDIALPYLNHLLPPPPYRAFTSS